MPEMFNRLGLAAAFAIGCVASNVYAGQLELSPMSLEIGAARNSELLYVTNRGTDESTIQIRSFSWSQTDGSDQLNDTQDLVASPPIFKLGPGKQQIVRVVLRAGRPNRESSYRIILDQLPEASEDNTVHVAWRVSLPVFVESGKQDSAALTYATARAADGSLLVTAANQGSRHTRLLGMKLHAPGGREFEPSKQVLGYVLPGSTITWPFAAEEIVPGATLTLHGTADTGPVDVQLTAPAAP
jgi:fimbrial chaperone protein